MTPRDSTMAIIADVAAPFGLTVADMVGAGRERRIAWPRQMAMAKVRSAKPAMSQPQIGALFGGRDHTTILHGIRAHNARMAWVEVLRLCADVPEQPDLFSAAA